jgi:hypothetical protein
MKTKIILLGAVVTAFTFTSLAANASLSPRAQTNQIKVVNRSLETPSATVAYTIPTSSVLLSPRAQSGQITVVKGQVNDVNPASACRNTMSGSPKVVAECSSHTTMPGCATVATLK